MEFRKMVTITLCTRQEKRHWCIEQSYGLCERGRGWEDLGEWHWKKKKCAHPSMYLPRDFLFPEQLCVSSNTNTLETSLLLRVIILLTFKVALDIWSKMLHILAQAVKNLPAMQETWVWSLGQEDPMEKRMATHSSILAWRIPRTEEPGGFSVHGVAKS